MSTGRRHETPTTAGDQRGPDEGTHGESVPSLQSRLRDRRPEPPAPVDSLHAADELVELMHTLEHDGRLHRDRQLGRVFHPGEVSFRESRRGNSLHISVDDNQVLAHVDLVSPLKLRSQRASRYSLLRIAAHNATGMAGDLVRLLRGRQGDHRCELDCEFSSISEDRDPGDLGPTSSPAGPDRPDDTADPRRPPWNVQLEVRVAGHLDEPRLRHALAETLGRYWRPAPQPETRTSGDGQEAPLAPPAPPAAPAPSSPLAEADQPLSVVDCPDDATLAATRAELQAAAVPLGVPPLRVVLARSPGGDVVMANCHFAAMDGFGALQVLRRVARAYAGQAPPPPPLDLLALRDVPIRPVTGATKAVWLYRAAVERVRNILTPPALVAPDQAGGAGFGYHHLALSEEDTQTLVHFDHPGTSTDVLLTALHLAIDAWNVQHGRPRGRISVLVSANLRSPELPEDAVGNFSVTARVSTSRRHQVHPGRALRVVTAQTSLTRRRRTGVALLEALHRLGLLVLWARQSVIVLEPLSGNRDVDTAMLCNLGRLTDPPDFDGGGEGAGAPIELWFSPPTRIPIGLSIGAATMAGRLHLVFRHPHRLFDDDAARRFASCYVEQLLRVVAVPRRPAS